MVAGNPDGRFDVMIELFSRSGIRVDDNELELLCRFYRELKGKNPTLNLTSLTSFEDIIIKHFVDCLLITKFIELKSPLLDIGTGAGFPALPLKITNPEIKFYLAESRKERISFLLDTIEILGLTGAEVYPHRVNPDFPIRVNGVITRALESARKTLLRCAPFLDPGARVILMKGPGGDDEISSATKLMEESFKLEKDISYTIPGTDYRRRLVVFERREK